MNKRTKALCISKEVKDKVYRRDKECCVWCGSPAGEPVAHYISRSQGGLGIEQNVLTLCFKCHRKYDQSTDRKKMRIFFASYLSSIYPKWDESKLTYRRE